MLSPPPLQCHDVDASSGVPALFSPQARTAGESGWWMMVGEGCGGEEGGGPVLRGDPMRPLTLA